MKIHSDRPGRRWFGTLVGLGFLAFGCFSLVGGGDELEAAIRDRAQWYGITLVIAGVLAVMASWGIRDIDGIWCAPPRRWWGRRRS